MNVRKTPKRAAGLAAVILLLMPSARACELAIIWKADLSGAGSRGGGTVGVAFDFAHPGADVRVQTTGLTDVRRVELHIARSYTDHAGPAVLTLSSSPGRPMPATWTRHITPADLQPQTAPKVQTFTDLVQAVLDGRAYVVVATKVHPEGEVSGVITMHKEAVYSDNPADAAHDPALHRAAEARQSQARP